jgi:hypothetical protein
MEEKSTSSILLAQRHESQSWKNVRSTRPNTLAPNSAYPSLGLFAMRGYEGPLTKAYLEVTIPIIKLVAKMVSNGWEPEHVFCLLFHHLFWNSLSIQLKKI